MNLVTQQSSEKLTITPESEDNSLQADHNNLHSFGLNGDILKRIAADDSLVTELISFKGCSQRRAPVNHYSLLAHAHRGI